VFSANTSKSDGFPSLFTKTVFKITEQLIRPALKDPQNGWLYQKEYIFGVRSNLFQDAARF